jgi:predicted NBD/HSP70 family sugar kinase
MKKYIGIDIGGTAIKIGLLCADGKVVFYSRISSGG